MFLLAKTDTINTFVLLIRMVQLIALNYFLGVVQFSVWTTFSIVAFFFNVQILHFGTIDVFELLAGTGTLFGIELLYLF